MSSRGATNLTISRPAVFIMEGDPNIVTSYALLAPASTKTMS